MIPELREQFNKEFTEEKYQSYIDDLGNVYPGHLDFRVAETPVFIPKWLMQWLMSWVQRRAYWLLHNAPHHALHKQDYREW